MEPPPLCWDDSIIRDFLEWNKAKDILIVVLSLVSLFLAFNLINLNNSKIMLPDDYLRGSCKILENKGLSVDPEILSRKKKNLPIITMPMRDMLNPIAKNLLENQQLTPSVDGGVTTFSEGSSFFSSPSYNEFTFLTKGESLSLKSLLQRAGYKSREYVLSEEGDSAQFLLEGIPVLGFTAQTLNDAELSGMSGKLLHTKPRNDETRPIIDCINALFYLAEHEDFDKIVVTGVYEAYNVTANATFNTVVASPVYVIVSDFDTYYIDALSGQLIT